MRTNHAFFLKPGEARSGGPLDILGDRVWIKLGGADTDGSYAIMENLTEPQAGPPLHRHRREDESFYVLEGEYLFEVDGKQIAAGPGCSIFAPRGTAHTFQNVGSTTGRMLAMVQPAGLDLFFSELAGATSGLRQPDLPGMRELFQKYGLELLGPPLRALTPVVRTAIHAVPA